MLFGVLKSFGFNNFYDNSCFIFFYSTFITNLIGTLFYLLLF